MYTPGNEAELSEIVSGLCAPVCVRGGASRDVGRVFAGDVLDVSNLSGIRLYEPGALSIVVGAGMAMDALEAALFAEGQRLAFEPMDHRVLLERGGEPTIGGCVAGNVSGPRRVAVGACRDHVLGVRFIDGVGRIISNGGRVMKNVTGYDLVKLMAGSWGTLGVISEVSLKVLPVPEVTQSLVVPVPNVAAGLAIMQRVMGTPYEVTGAAYRKGCVMLRVEGFAAQVAYRLDALQGLVGGDVAHVDWVGIRDVADLAALPVVWRVSLRPSRMAEMLDRIDAQFGSETLIDWGGGLAWIGFSDAHLAQATQYGADGQSGADVLRANMHHNAATLGGHATMVKASADLRAGGVFQPEPPGIAALSRALRQQFDPRGLLNPERMS